MTRPGSGSASSATNFNAIGARPQMTPQTKQQTARRQGMTQQPGQKGRGSAAGPSGTAAAPPAMTQPNRKMTQHPPEMQNHVYNVTYIGSQKVTSTKGTI